MASNSPRTSTIVIASIGTIVTGALAYAIYFDYRRRHDVDFRRNLKRESKKQAKVAKVEAESSKKQERQELRDLVDEANEEGFPTDADEKEAFFMQEVGQGEQLCQQSMSITHEVLYLETSKSANEYQAACLKRPLYASSGRYASTHNPRS
jgi:hypothetical protein